jgi:hypothetical protein
MEEGIKDKCWFYGLSESPLHLFHLRESCPSAVKKSKCTAELENPIYLYARRDS